MSKDYEDVCSHVPSVADPRISSQFKEESSPESRAVALVGHGFSGIVFKKSRLI